MMERRTSEVFKKWMTNEDIRRTGNDRSCAQGTAEDRVTAVNNELRFLSLAKGVTVFDFAGNVVKDLKALVNHVRAIKEYLDRGHYHEGRNKYGMPNFLAFITWLSDKPRLNTYDKIRNYLDGIDIPAESLPGGDVFKAFLLNKYRRITDNARCIWCRVQRVLRAAHHMHSQPTADELVAMIENIGDYVANGDVAANCKVALRHYMRALYGHDDHV